MKRESCEGDETGRDGKSLCINGGSDQQPGELSGSIQDCREVSRRAHGKSVQSVTAWG